MSSTIDGYVVTVGVYVEKSFFIPDDDEGTAAEVAIDEFKADIEGLDYEELDIEVLDISPEYHEDD
jgi:hypothetical protein